MLIVTRRVDEIITIEPFDLLDATPLATAFAEGSIKIKLVRVNGGKVRLAVEAPASFRVWRGARPAIDHGDRARRGVSDRRN